MEAMELDSEAVLTTSGSDPMLGKPPDLPAIPVQSQGIAAVQQVQQGAVQTAHPTPSGSFIVLKTPPQPGTVSKVAQVGNINFSNLQPGQGARAAQGRLTAVMGRPAGAAHVKKFIISQTGNQSMGGQLQRVAAPGAPPHVRMVQPVPNTGGHGIKIVSTPAYRPVQPDTLASPTKTITLTAAQAQEMGLLSPSRKGQMGDGPRQMGSPHRIVIHPSPSTQKTMAVHSGQPVRLVSQNTVPQQPGNAQRQAVQLVRVVGSSGGATSAAAAATLHHQTAPTDGALLHSNHQAAGAAAPLPRKLPIAPSQSQRLLLPATSLPPSYSTSQASDMGALAASRRTFPPKKTSKNAQREAIRAAQAAKTAVAAAAAAAQVGRATWKDDLPPIRPRKACNCTKSQCLKLYCDCFAAGEFCNNCNCTNCNNSLEFEEERQRAIRSCLDRNPYAFKPKIGKSDNETRKHQKGCHCKKSGCLKNYCECYEAKIYCASQCKCKGCKNHENANNIRMVRPGAESVSSVDDNVSSISSDADLAQPPGGASRKRGSMKVATFPVSDKAPLIRVTQDVIDATVQCLMTEACGPGDSELRVLNEFGRCISQIIDYSSRQGDPTDEFT